MAFLPNHSCIWIATLPTSHNPLRESLESHPNHPCHLQALGYLPSEGQETAGAETGGPMLMVFLWCLHKLPSSPLQHPEEAPAGIRCLSSLSPLVWLGGCSEELESDFSEAGGPLQRRATFADSLPFLPACLASHRSPPHCASL